MFEAMLKVQENLFAKKLISPTSVAMTAASLGNKLEALRYLQAAYEQRDSALLFVETNREFNYLYNEPAYRNLLARMNLPPQDEPSTQGAR